MKRINKRKDDYYENLKNLKTSYLPDTRSGTRTGQILI